MSKARSGLANDRRIYACYTSPETFTISIVSGTASLYDGTMTQVSIPGSLSESGSPSIANTLDDGDVPIPMASIVFNFFGTNYSNNLYWSSNNALIFGTPNPYYEINISSNLLPAILLGNYDRILKTFFYKNILTTDYSITILLVTFYDYYTDTISSSTYQYQIRLIKENVGSNRQFVEVYVISSPPSPGYSTGITSYPSGLDVNGNPQDSNGNPIDSTKHSPYNITNGTNFLNPCGSTYSTISPSSNTSFVFSSNSSGSSWVFTNNAYVNV
jgi:hypothetical protein